MHRLRRITILIAALAIVAAACSGDDGGNTDADQQEGGGSGEPVTLDYWVFESGGLAGSFAEQLIQEFEADEPERHDRTSPRIRRTTTG